MKINVTARQLDSGKVRVSVECDGQEAALVFDGSEVFVEVPEPAQAQA